MNPILKGALLVEMDSALWDLFDRYLFLINAKLKSREWVPTNRGRFAGALLAFVLLQEKDRILAYFDEAERKVFSQQFYKYFSEDQFPGIGFSEDALLCGTGREGAGPSHQEAVRAVRYAAGRRRASIRRRQRLSREV